MATPAWPKLSAVLLHYGNLLLGLGAVALPLRVRGRRGWLPSLVGALLSALALLGTSRRAVQRLDAHGAGPEPAHRPGREASPRRSSAHRCCGLCFGLDPLLLLGLPLVVFGLCRAGVLGWWTLVSVVAGTVLLPFSPASGNLVPTVAFVLIQLPAGRRRRPADHPEPRFRD